MAAGKPEVAGIKIQNYILIEEIGKGEFGLVCKAKKGREIFCIKRIIHKGIKEDVNEALGNLSHLPKHDRIVPVYEHFFHESEPRLYVVMKFMDTMNLNDLLCKKNVPEGQKLGLMLDITQGVNFLHNNKMVHGDIRPPNVWIQKSSDRLVAQIGDYGILPVAKDLSSNNQVREVAEFYRAPEVVKSGGFSQASDIFSLGETLYVIWKEPQTNHKGTTKDLLVPAARVGDDVYTLSCLVKNDVLGKVIISQISNLPALAHLIIAMMQVNPIKRPSVEVVMYKLAEAKGSFQAKSVPASPQIGNLGDLLLLKMMADMMKSDD